MSKPTVYLIIFLFPLIFFSCSEDEEPKPNTYSKLLTGEVKKTWQLSSFIIIEKDNPDNAYNLRTSNSCPDSIDYYDNYYTFYANAERKFEITEGPEKCSNFEHEDYHLEYFWTLENASATVSFVFLPLFGEAFVPYTLIDLTKDKMVIQFYDEGVDDRHIYRFVLNAVEEE